MVPRPSMNRCSSHALRRGISSTLVSILRRAPWRIFSGWGVTRSVSNRSLGCCARQHYGWSKATRRPRRGSVRPSRSGGKRGLGEVDRAPPPKLPPGKKQKKETTGGEVVYLVGRGETPRARGHPR